MRNVLDHNETQAVLALFVETQWRIRRLMEVKGLNQSGLAKAMGVSRARISQLFSDYPNITLETLACVFHALGESVEVTSPSLRGILAPYEEEAAEFEAKEQAEATITPVQAWDLPDAGTSWDWQQSLNDNEPASDETPAMAA